jgi:hypothetical protein
MPLAPSQLGRYQLLHPLGSRTQGTIYLAEDRELSSQVALKLFYLSDALQNPNDEVIERIEAFFTQEMHSIAQLFHPRLLPIYNSGIENIDAYLYAYVAMPYCPAGSLEDWLTQADGEGLTLSTLARVLENWPELLLTDFGVAQLFAVISSQGLSQSPYIRSTYLSLAPEQWDGKAVAASDQYGLAVLAFRLLTGQFPFQGTLSQVIRQHYQTPPPAPSALNPQLDPSVDGIIQRALAKNPAQRFPSVLEFSHAFARFQESAGDRMLNSVKGRLDPDATFTMQEHFPASFASAPAAAATSLATLAVPPALEAAEVAAPLAPASAASAAAPAEIETLPASELSTVLADPAPPSSLTEVEDATTLAPAAAEMDADGSALPTSDEEAPPVEASAAQKMPEAAQEGADALADLTVPAHADQVAVSLLDEALADILSTPTVRLHTRQTQPLSASALPAAIASDDLASGTDAPTRPAGTLPPAPAREDLARGAGAQPLTLAPTLLKVAPPLPVAPPVLPPPPALHLPVAPRGKVSLLRKSLLVALLALLILGGGGVLLVTNTLGHSYGSSGQITSNGSSPDSAQPGQTSAASTGITIIVTTTPATGGVPPVTTPGAISTPAAGSTPGSGFGSGPGSGPAAGSTPVSGSTPAAGSSPVSGSTPATPTPAPQVQPTPKPTSRPTPTPTPHPCLIHYWTLTLTTYSKGGHALYVSSYCHGVVYLTLTQAPASAGHKVYLQICYALNSTNCTGWVAYTSPNVWLTMATGLKTNQVFYINGKCSGCTSQFVMYGGAKY